MLFRSENKLGMWAELHNLGKEDLEKRKEMFTKAIELIDKRIEILGN